MDSSPRREQSGSETPLNHCAPTGVLNVLELKAWLERQEAESQRPPHQNIHGDALSSAASPTSASRCPRNDRLARAAAYLAKIPPAVAGQRGHDRTFHAACVLVRGFDLSTDEAKPLLQEWNLGCTPPWSAAELEHKLKDASRGGDTRPRGYLCEAPAQTSRQRRARGSDGPDPVSPPTQPAGAPALSPLQKMAECPEGQESNPHRLALLFLRAMFTFTGGIGLRFWRDDFHSWDGAAYHPIPDSEVRAQLTRFIADEFERLYRLELHEWARQTVDKERAKSDGNRSDRARAATGSLRIAPRPLPVTGRLVSDVVQALASLVMVPSRQFTAQPAWLPAWPAGIPTPGGVSEDDAVTWQADDILPAKNALVHLPSLLHGTARTAHPTPRFFNAYALEYDFDPAAPPPREWLSFLDQIWGSDFESIQSLQEWFGYLMTSDTKQQKILLMVGPKRSGRGTIARVLKALAGASSVVNPTLLTLARPFGLASFIGKPIAIFPDARLSSRPDNAAIVECLLSISGEDDQTIDRKHRPPWTGKLSTRFVLISNELPRLRDASGALAGRLIILRFTKSFYGQEDLALFDRLKPELPGILRWAIAGWERLNKRGRFMQPSSAGELVATMDELASPIAAFLRDRCIIEADAICLVSAMYEAWTSWCQEHGRAAVGDSHSFGRDLHAAVPALTTIRPRTALGRLRHYQGISLRGSGDSDRDID